MARTPFRFRSLPLAALFALAAAASGCGDVNVGKAESIVALAGAPGGPGFFDGSPADPVRFDSPSGVAVTSTGNRYVADTENHVIRKIDASGNVTTFAGKFGVPGTADGTGANARFSRIAAITAVGTFLYLCDNNAIRSVSPAGAVITLAGVPDAAGSTDNPVDNTNVRFSSPSGITSNGATILFVADTGNHRIRKVSTATGATTPVAGSGTPGFTDNTLATSAGFNSPEGVAFDGASLFVADTGNHAIRKVASPFSSGEVSTLAGDGAAGFVDDVAGTSARFSSPRSLISVGSDLFVADTGNHVIRKVDTTNANFVTTLAGLHQVAGFGDGTGSAALFDRVRGLGIQEGVGTLFFAADTGNHVLRQVTVGGAVTTVAGNPPRRDLINATGENARFDAPAGVAVIGDDLFLSDRGNNTIRKVTSAGGVTSLTGSVFRSPQGIVAVGNDLYVADSENHAVRKVTSAGVVTTFAGSTADPPGLLDGTGSAARFHSPKGIATDGSFLYVADAGNHAVRKIEIGTAVVTTLAGDGAAGSPTDTPSRFNGPEGIAVLGGNLYVADTGNHAIRKVTPTGVVSTFAGSTTGASGFVDDATGTAARFDTPRGIAAVNSVLYVADTGNHVVRRISTLRKVTPFAGDSGAATTRNGIPSVALMNAPTGIAGVPGTIYFTDTNENVVRKILF